MHLQVQYLEPTPPTEDLLLISTVTHVEEYKENPSRRDSVQVDLQLCKVSFYSIAVQGCDIGLHALPQ